MGEEEVRLDVGGWVVTDPWVKQNKGTLSGVCCRSAAHLLEFNTLLAHHPGTVDWHCLNNKIGR